MGSYTAAQSVSAASLTSFVGRERWIASNTHDWYFTLVSNDEERHSLFTRVPQDQLRK